MRELRQIRDAVIGRLNQGGLMAMAAFPQGRAKAYAGPAAAVAVETAQDAALGFCGYLGERADEKTGELREIYGRRLEGVITVDVRGASPTASGRGSSPGRDSAGKRRAACSSAGAG